MRTIRKTVLSMMLLLAGMSASAQETQFLSNNHCLYRIHQSEKYLLIPVQESAEMSHVKVIANNQQLKTFNVRLANTHVDYYVPLDLEAYKSQKGLMLDIHVDGQYRNDGGIANFGCWKGMKFSDSFDMKNREQYRPLYHHTPVYGWMNDPNGMFYKDGVWHLQGCCC